MSEALDLRAPRVGGAGRVSGATASAGRLANLQVLRAVAAGCVVLFHIALQLKDWAGDARFAAVLNMQLGMSGVALFFAISGYLMALLVRATDAPSFLLHRIVRIYPAFLLVVLGFLALGAALGTKPPVDWWTVTLAPVGDRVFVLGRIEWTLVHETVFYLGLFLLASAGLVSRIETIALGWLAVMAAAALSGFAAGAMQGGLLIETILLSDANVAFAAGLLLPWLIRRNLLPAGMCSLAVPLFALVLWTEFPHIRWVLGLASALAVAGLVQVPQVSAAGPLGRAFVRLGDWSYVLYLVHVPVFYLLDGFVASRLGSGALFAAKLALALAAASLLGPLDLRVYRRVRTMVDRRSLPLKRAAAWCFAAAYLGCAASVSVQVWRDRADLARMRAALDALPAGALASEASLREAIAAAGRAAPPGFVGEAEGAAALPTGQILVTAWAVDLGRPELAPHLAVICGGRIAAIAPPGRYRRDVAGRLGRPDLARRRIGFVATIEPGACAPGGPLLTVFGSREGKLLAGRTVLAAPPRP